MKDIPLRAYEDLDFLSREELRPVRVQTELLKPQLIMDDEAIQSTVCVFGSARTPCPTTAQALLHDMKEAFKNDPSDENKAELAIAQQKLKDSHYYALAREFSAKMTRFGQTTGALEYVICTGGGPGIMEAANRGAADVHGKSIGLNITLPHEQYPNQYITDELNFMFHYFAIRKIHFLMRAKALCAFPGGFGTMDELFETLTLIQTSKQEKIPVILFGQEFWESIINFDAFVERNVISPEDLDLFTYCEDPDEAVNMILEFHKDK